MRTTFLALLTACLLAACAGSGRQARAPDKGGHATPGGAAFMGYHGPVWRDNTPAD
jgi:hypothetical protein